HHPSLHSFPTRRSSDLVVICADALAVSTKRRTEIRILARLSITYQLPSIIALPPSQRRLIVGMRCAVVFLHSFWHERFELLYPRDRKSTRLNSSHLVIS